MKKIWTLFISKSPIQSYFHPTQIPTPNLTSNSNPYLYSYSRLFFLNRPLQSRYYSSFNSRSRHDCSNRISTGVLSRSRAEIGRKWKFTIPTPMSTARSSIHQKSYSSSSSASKQGENCKSNPEKIKILIFYGSVRENRFVERVGGFVQKVLTHQGMEPIIFDPIKLNFEMLKIPLHYYPPKDRDKIPKWLMDANAVIQQADGFILLSTEYNSLAPPALTNMLSHFPRESYRHRPAGLVSYTSGAFGGCRAAISLKCMMNDLGMIIVPTTVYIPMVHDAFPGSNGKCTNELAVTNVKHLIRELHWYSKALKKARQEEAPPKPPQNQ